jgi:hypothetical protein
MSKFQNGLRASAAAPAPAAKGELEWENVQMEELSPDLQAKFVAMLDARKGFEDAMIAASQKAKLINKTETLLFGYKFLTRGQVSIAAAPIKRQTKAKSRFAL